jgi:hypothetical protein
MDVRRNLVRLRLPLLAVAGIAALVVLLPPDDLDPFTPLAQYWLRTVELGVVAIGAFAAWRASAAGRGWDADVIAVLWGLIGAYTIVMALHGTPFSFAGLVNSDQSFRTESVTRFADSWVGADYFYRGLPAYYAPALPWLEGRVADLAGIAPWRMIKLGTIAAAFGAPLFAYVMWRRQVPPRIAALIAGSMLLIWPVFYEPYAWVVLAVLVPWWLEAGPGLRRPDVRPLHPVILGVIGGVLACTYYYYLFIYLFVVVIWLVLARDQVRAHLGRMAVIAAVAAVVSAPFWGPFVVDLVRGGGYHPKNNRYLVLDDGVPALLPMLAPTFIGVLCLVGLVYLVWTVGQPLSRWLLIFLAAAYLYQVVGFFAVLAGTPLMNSKMRDVVPLVLLTAAVLGLARLASIGVERLDADAVRRTAVVLGAALGLIAVDGYVTTITTHEWVRLAHTTPYPDGSLPRFAGRFDAKPRLDSAEAISRAIDARVATAGHPVLFSDRQDVFAFYPYYGFVQWNFAYSHPGADFDARIAYVERMSFAATPQEFSRLAFENPFDPIDAIVLRHDGTCLTFTYVDDNFPDGYRTRDICVPERLVTPDQFDITTVGDYLVAVRRTA